MNENNDLETLQELATRFYKELCDLGNDPGLSAKEMGALLGVDATTIKEYARQAGV